MEFRFIFHPVSICSAFLNLASADCLISPKASQCRARGGFFQHRNACPTAGISSFLPLRVCYERTPNVL